MCASHVVQRAIAATVGEPAAARLPSCRSIPSAAVVTLHEVDDRLARRRPFRLVAEHGGADAPSADLGHRGDDRVVLERPAPSAVDDAGDEVAPDEVERRRPAVDPDPVALAQRLEVLVIPDGVMIVLGQMGVEVDPAPRPAEALDAPTVVHRLVADMAGRKLDVGAWRLAIWEPAAAAERRAAGARRRSALEADREPHRLHGRHPAEGRGTTTVARWTTG